MWLANSEARQGFQILVWNMTTYRIDARFANAKASLRLAKKTRVELKRTLANLRILVQVVGLGLAVEGWKNSCWKISNVWFLALTDLYTLSSKLMLAITGEGNEVQQYGRIVRMEARIFLFTRALTIHTRAHN